ncbi:hypothetical protein BJ878DRAFT_538225 [Calycina marina]|uniref:Succinate dehydrogenase assembly factor 4, mitochondrial n=1 Tax=Calycina marina TaxID=1763456 RepID=A0A9P8CKJ5_9HELO|nr:hypothetical protein BJ878DRAFT_538225 [Calycina marina]
MSRLLARILAQSSRPRSCGFSTTIPRPAFATGPTPPRLPAKEQEEFERLQKASTGAFSTPRIQRPQINQSPDMVATKVEDADAGADGLLESRIEAQGKGAELHPDVRRGTKPEFEGDVNPKTGEVGGPKNEPLKWGSQADWSYNGRVTDF